MNPKATAQVQLVQLTHQQFCQLKREPEFLLSREVLKTKNTM
jgi:hypothetical protein